MLPFSVWAQSGVPPWAELASCRACLTSCTLEQAVLLWVVVLGSQLAFLHSFASASSDVLPTSSLNKARSTLPKFKISIVLPAYLTSSRNLISPSYNGCCQGSDEHLTALTSWLTSGRLSSASPNWLVTFFNSCGPWLFFWFACPLACCTPSRCWGGENPQGDTGPAIKRLLPGDMADFIHFFLGLVACSRYQPHNYAHWPPLSSWPLSFWPVCHLLLCRALQTQIISLHEAQLQILCFLLLF